VLGIFYHGRIKFFENLLLFIIGQILDRLILDIPLASFIVRRVIAEAIGIAADLVELAGLQPDGDIFDAPFAFMLDPPR
jgi:hypothetical protein